MNQNEEMQIVLTVRAVQKNRLYLFELYNN
jgi:hypothetical protein